jgi:hypothetical protein
MRLLTNSCLLLIAVPIKVSRGGNGDMSDIEFVLQFGEDRQASIAEHLCFCGVMTPAWLRSDGQGMKDLRTAIDLSKPVVLLRWGAMLLAPLPDEFVAYSGPKLVIDAPYTKDTWPAVESRIDQFLADLGFDVLGSLDNTHAPIRQRG